MTLKSPGKARRKMRPGGAQVRVAANAHCLRNYGVGYTGGTPRRLTLRDSPVWIVPVVLTSPGYGHVGEVGVVAVDPQSCAILDATPKSDVRAAGAKLAREKRDDLDAAFHRARTV